MNTHKIILAGISDFIKSIIEEIPVGDQVTLFMPDFTSEDIEKFLLVSIKSLDLEKAFGVKAQKQDGNVKIKRTYNLLEDCKDMPIHSDPR